MRCAKACLLGLVYALTAGGGAYCGILAMVLNPARYPRLSPFCGIAAAVAMVLLILWGWLEVRRGADPPLGTLLEKYSPLLTKPRGIFYDGAI